MPMPINSLDEYDKVVNVSWYTPEKERSELEYVFFILLRRSSALITLDFHWFYRSLRCTHCVALTSEIS
jgi:hypothetical protein